jgi:RNA-directed DNA polymerase
LRDARQERFDFLGCSFGPHCFRQEGRWYTGASPPDQVRGPQKSVQRLKDKVGAILVPGNMGAWEEVRDTLNRLLRGWCGYFSPGSHYTTDRVIEAHLYDRVRNFLARRRKLPSRGSRQIRMDAVFGTLGVLRPRVCRRAGATA